MLDFPPIRCLHRVLVPLQSCDRPGTLPSCPGDRESATQSAQYWSILGESFECDVRGLGSHWPTGPCSFTLACPVDGLPRTEGFKVLRRSKT
jgi:hypothetical protein